MNDPFADILPQALHFSRLEGSQLVLLLGIVMFFGAFGGRLFQKFKIPQVVGYIVIGIIIGASGFQILRPEIIAALNPINTVALSFIGFLVGGELKIDVIKKYGKQFVGILLFEAIVPFFVVGGLVFAAAYAVTQQIVFSFSIALVLGAISSATAPAATTDVLKEFRTRGPLTTTVLGIVAMDDAVALILYAVASSVAAPLLGGVRVPLGAQLLAIARDIFCSVLAGGAMGFVLSYVVRSLITEEGRILSFTLGALFITTGLCVLIDLDNILAAMSLGFFMINFAPAKTRSLFKLTEKFTPPIYVLFFVLVGAKLNIWLVTPFLGMIAVLYVVGRTAGKAIGSRFGARLTGAPDTVRRFLPFCLLSQAGVAIGLSIAAGQQFADSIGPQILLIITATTFIVQLLGPICVKYGVSKAGECGLDVTEEDIRNSAKVSDVSWGTHSVCEADSPAVVPELQTIDKIIDSFTHGNNLNYVVKDSAGRLTGVISVEHLKEMLQLGAFASTMLAIDIMDKPLVTCAADTPLPDLYKLYSDYDLEAIPIVDKEQRALGIVEKFTVDHYIHARILELHSKLEKMG